MNETVKPVGKNISFEIRVEKKHIHVVNADESPESRLFVKVVGDDVTLKYENLDGEMVPIEPGCEVICDPRFPKLSLGNKQFEDRVILPEAAIICVLIGLPDFKAMTKDEMTNFAPKGKVEDVIANKTNMLAPGVQ